MENKKNFYTKDEFKELQVWFEAQNLPESMQVDKATYIPNLKETVLRLLDQAKVCHDNPKMQGCLILLEHIKQKLEE